MAGLVVLKLGASMLASILKLATVRNRESAVTKADILYMAILDAFNVRQLRTS